MDTFFRTLKFSITSLLTISLIGCSSPSATTSGSGQGIGHNKSPAPGAITITAPTSENGMIYVTHSGTGTSADPIIMEVKIRDANNTPIPGTVHWGDFTDDRVYNGTVLTHVYEQPGSYTIAIVPDGGEKIVISPDGFRPTFTVPDSTSTLSGTSNGSDNSSSGEVTVFGCSSSTFTINPSTTLVPYSITSPAAGPGTYSTDLIPSCSDGEEYGLLRDIDLPYPSTSSNIVGPANARICRTPGQIYTLTITIRETGEFATCSWTVVSGT